VAVTIFGVGLVLLGVGAVLAGVAVWRSALLPRYAGVLFAIGFALFIPQFFLGASPRIGHGVLVAVGCWWLAAALWKASTGYRGALARMENVPPCGSSISA